MYSALITKEDADTMVMLRALPDVRYLLYFFFNNTSTTEIYTLSLHDALPIRGTGSRTFEAPSGSPTGYGRCCADRKSTRLNSSHRCISYAVFCLKKKRKAH